MVKKQNDIDPEYVANFEKLMKKAEKKADKKDAPEKPNFFKDLFPFLKFIL